MNVVKKGGFQPGHITSLETRKRIGDSNRKHGMSLTPEYKCWVQIKRRCSNPKDSHYHLYGGRGITVCPRWLESFENFFDDMSKRPNGYQIDRKNNNGNYEPSNCRWASLVQQANNKRNIKFYTLNGETHSLAEWSRLIGIKKTTLFMRLHKYGWSLERALCK